MAEPVKTGFQVTFRRAAAGLPALLLALAVPAAAAELRDPTVPATGGYAQSGQQMSGSGPMLQSVMISRTSRMAVISGQAVKLGEKYGDSQVVRITESEVVLQGSGGTQTLKLYPGVEKKVISRAGPRKETRQH